MNSRDYFVLGSKLLGVYCLFLAVPHLGAAVATLADPPNLGDEYASIMFMSRVVFRIIPVVYLVFGFYLIRNGSVIHNLAYQVSSDEDNLLETRDKFIVFLKFLGMFLIVSYFPDVLKSISSYFTYRNAFPTLNLFEDKQYALVNFGPSIVGVVFGFYLLKSGQVFVRLAFRSDAPTTENHKSRPDKRNSA